MSQKYKKASFRGVKFFVSESEAQFGRRNVLHEYPQREKPFSEDLGKKAQAFNVEGYVLGDDFRAQLEALITAAEKPGAGVLVHPYYGQKYVALSSPLSVRETQGETRIARVSFQFVEAGEPSTPKASDDGNSLVGLASLGLQGAAESDFLSSFSIDGLPEFAVSDAIETLNAAADRLAALRGNVSSVYNNVAEFTFAVRNLRTSAVNLVNNPAELAKKLMSAVNLLGSTFGAVGKDTQKALKGLLTFGSTDKPVPTRTSTREQQARNRSALNALVVRGALAAASNAAAQTTYASSSEGIQARDELLDAMDTIEETASDEVYQAIGELRAQVARHVPAIEAGLPSIQRHFVETGTNVLVLSHALYGDLSGVEDIASRNRLRHPGFIAPGTELEVLTNE